MHKVHPTITKVRFKHAVLNCANFVEGQRVIISAKLF